jgi:hypothetical protein
MITCPACNGTGEIYYNENGDRISYALLPADAREVESCEECYGAGSIEDIYGLDYD